MKYCIGLFVLVGMTAALFAGEQEDRARRVRVALAISAAAETPAVLPPMPMPEPPTLTDFKTARAKCLSDGTPIVILVGRCDGKQLAGEKLAASVVKLSEYDIDEITPTNAPRIVIAERGPRGLLVSTLPCGVDVATIRHKVATATMSGAKPRR